MKKFILVLAFLITAPVFSAEVADWGRTGHRATGEIAEQYLTKKAKRAIKKLLDGQSLAFTSTYADEIKSDERYWDYSPWHYVNFPFDKTYETHPKSEKGDLVAGIAECIAVIKDASASEEDKAFHLKLLIHFIGDLHQPLHVGIAEDRGANLFQVLWFDEGTNLHTVWDTKMLESYNMSYSELAANADELTEAEFHQIRQGTVLDWVAESRALCEDIYAHTKTGENLKWQYMYRYVNVARSQIQKGGVRLAMILNELFD